MSFHTIGQMEFEVLTMASCFSSLFTKTTSKYLQQSIIRNMKEKYQTIRFRLR